MRTQRRADGGNEVYDVHPGGSRIAFVIDTHVHADHYSGGPELALELERDGYDRYARAA